jgi:hypothetical protein
MRPENRDRALRLIKEELPELQTPVVIDHYNKLIQAIESTEDSKVKILVLHPIAAGDIICSQLSAELFYLKYSKAQVIYLTETPEAISVLQNNPFIDDTIQIKGFNMPWDQILAKYKKERECDHAYALYWWNPPSMKSLLEDLELPNDYTRVHLWKHDEYNENAKKIWGNTGQLKIAVHSDIDHKWGGGRANLVAELSKRGLVKLIGPADEGCGNHYTMAIEMLREADIMVCAHGSLAHASNAVNTPTVEISVTYRPEWVSSAYYHAPYDTKSVVVRPSSWCGNYACTITDIVKFGGTRPPACFNQNRFTPQLAKCNHGHNKTCTFDIPLSLVLEKFDELIKIL